MPAPARLQLVDSAAAAIARAQRIDALGIDRSHFLRYALPVWSPEAAAREKALHDFRMQTTYQDRVEAWRGLFALTTTKKKKPTT